MTTPTESDLLDEAGRLRRDEKEFEQAFRKAITWPVKGRPAKWKGRHGFDFVAGVLAAQSGEKCDIATAIQAIKKADPAKWRENKRDLERRFQEIKAYWGPWVWWRMDLDRRKQVLRDKIAECKRCSEN
jgi:hypothetical protein